MICILKKNSVAGEKLLRYLKKKKIMVKRKSEYWIKNHFNETKIWLELCCMSTCDVINMVCVDQGMCVTRLIMCHAVQYRSDNREYHTKIYFHHYR